ncbi:MAG TPA: hypothetical protein ENJ85_05105 [Oceanithermus profundus]|uniref:Uncharacterized protein n=1 Tax=Oceanithermus profundus TaxID=187137 RepID=A0A7C5WTG1_9DEIN|nr:hypothetical protein [Oceanithermus profundus]
MYPFTKPGGGGTTRNQVRQIARAEIAQVVPSQARLVVNGIGANAVSVSSPTVVPVFGKFPATAGADVLVEPGNGAMSVTATSYTAGAAGELDQLDVTVDASGATAGDAAAIVVNVAGVTVGYKVVNVV